jgi:hypothetical protein
MLYIVAGAYLALSIGLIVVMSYMGRIQYDSVYFYPSLFWDGLACLYHGLFFAYGVRYLLKKHGATIMHIFAPFFWLRRL